MANTPTENEYFQKPAKGDVDWDDENNGNWDAADQQLVSRKAENLLINGRFDIWQRGDSHQQGGFFADRWKASIVGNATVTWSKFDNGAHGENFNPHSAYSLEMNYDNTASAGDSVVTFENKIPNPERFSGKRICVSFEVSGPDCQFVVDGNVKYGSESSVWFQPAIATCASGSITRNVVFFDVPECPTDVSVIGGNFMAIRFLVVDDNDPDVVMPDTGSLYFSNVALTISDAYVPVVAKSAVEEFTLCQAFYSKGWGQFGGSVIDGTNCTVRATYPAPMIRNPTIALDIVSSDGFDTATLTSDRITNTASAARMTANATRGGYYNITITCDAEL